ncbi:hypothetical protein SC09_Contig24orf00472 [Bacillus subtilis]|uniref:Uncharacterized protein n=1 Tax=Bacillus subtilis TaxID=1423 RepID=A0A0D1IQ40_BACIU|nr:hypothetical protein SC09_Contig24orf00472 [Bacillus subtilis]
MKLVRIKAAGFIPVILKSLINLIAFKTLPSKTFVSQSQKELQP